MTSCRVHNVRFYKPVPRAIHCMAYESKNKKLALSRSDGSIEVWDVCYTPHIERSIPAITSGTVEDLTWCRDRLFCTGLHGMVTEFNLLTLQIKNESPLTSGPGWCLGVNRKKTRLAVGTEDGYINIFEVEDSDLTYMKLLDKQEGRILCLAWHGLGEVLVTGSQDSVRVWNVHSGHAIHRMTTGRAEASKETIVWCVAIADDFTVISGDSRGWICFWDAQIGTQVQKVQSHKADILTLCLTEDQNTVFCAGVDPIIASFARVKAREGQMGHTKWVKSIDRRVHDNDVRALLSTGEKQLYSAGVDGYLVSTIYPPKLMVKYSPIMQPPLITVCQSSRCLLMRYDCHLEVWRLGKSVPVEPSSHGILPLQQDCVKLLHLSSRNAEPIVCCSMSRDSRWLAYSTPSIVRFFSFSLDGEDGQPHLEKLSGFSADNGPAHTIVFAPDGSYAVVVANLRDVRVVQMGGGELTVVHTLRPTVLKDYVHLVTFSPDGKFLVMADRKSNIAVWTTSSWEHYCSLPKMRSAPTAMAVQDGTDFLVVVYADHKIVEFSLKRKEKKYTAFSRSLDDNLPRQWVCCRFPVTSVTFDPRCDDVFLMHDDASIWIINKNKRLPKWNAKIPRIDTSSDSQSHLSHEINGTFSHNRRNNHTNCAFNVLRKYKHLVYVGWLGDDEMVVLEVTPLSLEEHLPPSLQQKRFGGI